MGTKEKIVQKALELFNEQGIEYVGMRELAASLGMQIGNINYYFPTKDDLVDQLAMDLSGLNERTLVATDDLTLISFLEMREKVFVNQLAYRCLFLSFVHIVRRNPAIAERYGKVRKARRDGFMDSIELLQKRGYIGATDPGSAAFLASATGLVARSWISEAAISGQRSSAGQQIRHYVGLIARILMPYATKQGRRQIEAYLER
jgi:AcrR family transcriptional regulator